MEKRYQTLNLNQGRLNNSRQIEETGEEIILTDHGKPMLRVIPSTPEPSEAMRLPRDPVVKFIDPARPIRIGDQEVPQ